MLGLEHFMGQKNKWTIDINRILFITLPIFLLFLILYILPLLIVGMQLNIERRVLYTLIQLGEHRVIQSILPVLLGFSFITSFKRE